jgi:hypothetical protein
MKLRVLKFLSSGRSGRKQEFSEVFDAVKNASTGLSGSLVRPPDITSTENNNRMKI